MVLVKDLLFLHLCVCVCARTVHPHAHAPSYASRYACVCTWVWVHAYACMSVCACVLLFLPLPTKSPAKFLTRFNAKIINNRANEVLIYGNWCSSLQQRLGFRWEREREEQDGKEKNTNGGESLNGEEVQFSFGFANSCTSLATYIERWPIKLVRHPPPFEGSRVQIMLSFSHFLKKCNYRKKVYEVTKITKK